MCSSGDGFLLIFCSFCGVLQAGYPVGGGELTFTASSTRSLSPPTASSALLTMRSASERSRCSGTPFSNSSAVSYAPVNLPPLRWPSADHLSPGGVFLLDAANGLWVRVGEEVSPAIVMDLFEVPRVEELPQVRD